MDDLIKALQILRKYLKEDNYSPTYCEHDLLTIMDVDPSEVSPEDVAELDRLGFHISDEYGEEAFASFRFGSA
jgi:hypothetical protein